MKKNMIVLLCLVPGLVFATIDEWQDITQDQLNVVVDEFQIQPDKYRAVSLNIDGLQAQLNNRMAVNGSVEMILPKPNGDMAVFQVSVYDMMEPSLMKKFPEIQTFHGFNVANPREKVYMDITPKGLHAMSLGADHSFWIDPVSNDKNSLYASYYKGDYSNKHSGWNCGVEGHEHGQDPNISQSRGFVLSNELTLKRYRLAVAATVEYTSFHGGTVASGMAAIVTAMVRVNGIYENDLGIRMILVGDNDLIVYDTAPDPYSNNNGVSMLGQNQSNLDDVIGSENYDIGHVFSTGGGGVAYLGVPCTGSKAGGVTGLNSPVGDVFWVDYVAHEMGHQWGGNHTFNSVSGSCGGNNRSSGSAYEPGSATTIQGYAGICSSDNIQNNSDAYFHAKSLESMNNYATFGSGSVCSDVVNTGNNAPSVSINSPSSLTIPVNTPFELCGDANDVDTNNNQLTYNWEQYDLGPAGSPNSPSGNAPIFRSFMASSSGCRAFPQWSDILNNTQTKGEILPSYDRGLSFRLTVRDNELNGGAYNTAEYSMAVSAGSGPFLVTYPNSAVSFNAYEFIDVEWDVAGTDLPPVSCSNVDLMMSTNGGNSFFSLVLNTANDGIEGIQLPNVDSNQVRIKVQCSDNVFFDVSNANFTVVGDDLIFADGFEQDL